MLNLEEYISSGIVESYVLGLVDESEKLEFESLLLLHPQLNTSVWMFETKLEEVMVSGAIPAPGHVWNKVDDRINPERFTGGGKKQYNGRNGKDGDTIIPIVSSDQIRVHKNFKYAFIALVILSKIFLYTAIYYYLLYKDEMKQRIRLENQLHNAAPASQPLSSSAVPY